ncbi:MAG: hypothetical protein JNN08_22115 [Bryobacterales bacterium]|nr:hypothetical protein [Bryobacterales bacterium]
MLRPLAFLIWLALVGALTAQEITVRPLSSRADMVTGGTALVEVAGTAPLPELRLTVNGRETAAAFRTGPGGRVLGRIEGLPVGKSRVELRAGRQKARIEVVNYPITGPVFSGPHQAPFVCQTEAAGLGPALDSHCSAKTQISWVYKSNDPAKKGFQPFDPAGPRPADLARTTTTHGHAVDFIVRRERGTINRAIYEIAIVQDPAEPMADPWTETKAWNRRLVYTFGGGCRAGYRQGGAASALNEPMLALGYAVAASSLNVLGNNCNDLVSAETLMMVKAHFVTRFGVPVHTIGWGGSGGSIQQHLIAQNYPGLLDGILPTASYSDIISVAPGTADCSLLEHAFGGGSSQWTEEQKTAVSGYATWGVCTKGWIKSGYSPAWVSPAACAPVVPQGSARCTLEDNQVNAFGRDPKTGHARRALDNVGVQYGLAAFQAGKISAAQFVELNERVGGYDHDGNLVAERTVADKAGLRAAYRTGRINSGGGGLGTVPIIDFRAYVDLSDNIHDRYRSLATRARLKAANGHADNQVILTNPPPRLSISFLRQMDQWLDNIAKDTSPGTAAQKVVRNRPSDVVDACWTATGEKIAEPQTYDGPGRCNELYPNHGNPRIAAGGPLRDDVIKCALKPLNPADYSRPLNNEQLDRLRRVFPEGVCDYSKPGVEQGTIDGPWRRY